MNTRPEVPSDERRKRNKVNGFLSVDAISGQEYLLLSPNSESKDVASYMALLCDDLLQAGYEKISIFLDNNSTHKEKMKKLLNRLLSSLELSQKISIEFIPIPAYSPKLNLVEYIIHQLRLKILHHLPLDITIADIEEKIENYFKNGQLQTPKQIQNTIGHIYKLATQS